MNQSRQKHPTRFPALRRRGQSSERGANLIEMALVSMLLLLLLAGVVDMGRAFYSYIAITNASREGARYAARVPHLPIKIRDATKDEAASSGIALTDAQITITPDPTTAPAATGSPVQVEVQFDVPTIMGGILGFNNIHMRSSTEMIVFGQG